jgi:tetratricopeptide (TPR) repeat protein
MSRRSSTLWLAVLLPLTAASAVAAQPAEAAKPKADDVTASAREHFQRGTEYYSEGDFRAALIEFERAYALRPSYRLLYNLAQVAYELRDYAAAERHFRAYLVEGEDEITPERRAEVRHELDRLRERVASLDIRTEPSGAQVHVDDRLVGTTPFSAAVRVSAGRRRVLAELPGYAPVTRAIDVAGGEDLSVELRFGPPLIASSADTGPSSGKNVAPWITGIAGGVFALGSAAFGYSAWRDSAAYQDELKQFTNRDRLDELSSQAHTKAVISDVLLGAAVISLSVTAVLLLSSEHPATAQQPAAAKAF